MHGVLFIYRNEQGEVVAEFEQLVDMFRAIKWPIYTGTRKIIGLPSNIDWAKRNEFLQARCINRSQYNYNNYSKKPNKLDNTTKPPATPSLVTGANSIPIPAHISKLNSHGQNTSKHGVSAGKRDQIDKKIFF